MLTIPATIQAAPPETSTLIPEVFIDPIPPEECSTSQPQ